MPQQSSQLHAPVSTTPDRYLLRCIGTHKYKHALYEGHQLMASVTRGLNGQPFIDRMLHHAYAGDSTFERDEALLKNHLHQEGRSLHVAHSLARAVGIAAAFRATVVHQGEMRLIFEQGGDPARAITCFYAAMESALLGGFAGLLPADKCYLGAVRYLCLRLGLPEPTMDEVRAGSTWSRQPRNVPPALSEAATDVPPFSDIPPFQLPEPESPVNEPMTLSLSFPVTPMGLTPVPGRTPDVADNDWDTDVSPMSLSSPLMTGTPDAQGAPYAYVRPADTLLQR